MQGACEVDEMPGDWPGASMRESLSGGDPEVQVVQRGDEMRHGRAVARFLAEEVACAKLS